MPYGKGYSPIKPGKNPMQEPKKGPMSSRPKLMTVKHKGKVAQRRTNA